MALLDRVSVLLLLCGLYGKARPVCSRGVAPYKLITSMWFGYPGAMDKYTGGSFLVHSIAGYVPVS